VGGTQNAKHLSEEGFIAFYLNNILAVTLVILSQAFFKVWRSSRSFHKQLRCLILHSCRSNLHPNLHDVRYGDNAFMSDPASKALAEPSLPGEPQTYDARSKRSGIPLTTLYYRNHGRRSKEEKAQSQQYLTPLEEKALERYLKLMADLGDPVRIKFLPSLAFSIARRRSITNKVIKAPSKNWAQAFQKRHPALRSRRVRPMAWERHENNIYDKITHWFEVIREVLQDPAILPENVYNMDETGVMLCMLGSIQVLVSRDDPRDYRRAGVKRTMVTAIECISANGRSLLPMIIWPATTHRSNWTMFPTPGWHYACSESGYTDSKISLEWLKRVFDP
jgi:hypothetical protein